MFTDGEAAGRTASGEEVVLHLLPEVSVTRHVSAQQDYGFSALDFSALDFSAPSTLRLHLSNWVFYAVHWNSLPFVATPILDRMLLLLVLLGLSLVSFG